MARTPSADFFQLENLESRTLLTTTVVGAGPILVIRGTDANDLITLSVRLNSERVKVLRVLNRTLTDYVLTDVRQIQVEALDGPDTVVIDKNTVRAILVNGGLGNDSITGGSGNDTLIGGRGFDAISGGDGNDGIKGYSGNDTLSGGDGDDVIDGGEDDDFIVGGEGNDTLIGNVGRDQLYGEDGDDDFFARDGFFDTVSGGSGTDQAQVDERDLLGSISFQII